MARIRDVDPHPQRLLIASSFSPVESLVSNGSPWNTACNVHSLPPEIACKVEALKLSRFQLKNITKPMIPNTGVILAIRKKKHYIKIYHLNNVFYLLLYVKYKNVLGKIFLSRLFDKCATFKRVSKLVSRLMKRKQFFH